MDKLLRPEQAPCGWLDAERLKESLRDKHSRGRHWLAVPEELEIVGPGKGEVAADRLKRAVLLLEVLRRVRGVSLTGFAGFGILFYNPHKLLRLGERQRAQKLCVDHAEDGNVGANSESQDDDRDQRESTITAQRAQGIFQVLRKNIQFHALCVSC